MGKKTTLILAIALLLVLGFIWGNSVLPVEVSAKISGTVRNFMAGILGEGDASTTVGEFSVRKLGHFFEYAVLGVVTCLLFWNFIRPFTLFATATVSVGLFVPLVDETIQIFSGRGHSLVDVWIDTGGYVLGCCAVCAVLVAVKLIFPKSKKPQ